jgi:hypothetical protein
MNSRLINTITLKNLSAGEHITPIQTSDLAAGQYVYGIYTSVGGGIASKFTVAK